LHPILGRHVGSKQLVFQKEMVPKAKEMVPKAGLEPAVWAVKSISYRGIGKKLAKI